MQRPPGPDMPVMDSVCMELMPSADVVVTLAGDIQLVVLTGRAGERAVVRVLDGRVRNGGFPSRVARGASGGIEVDVHAVR